MSSAHPSRPVDRRRKPAPDRFEVDRPSRFLPLEWQRPGCSEQSALAHAVLLDVFAASGSMPSVSFWIEAHRCEVTAGLIIDPATTTGVLLTDATLAAIETTAGFGCPVSDPTLGELATWSLVVEHGPDGRHIVNHLSAPWVVAKKFGGRVWMRVDLLGAADENDRVPCSVGFGGDEDLVGHVAGLAAADTPGPLRLVATPMNGRAAVIELPLSMVAHLFSTPSRLPDVWPEHAT